MNCHRCHAKSITLPHTCETACDVLTTTGRGCTTRRRMVSVPSELAPGALTHFVDDCVEQWRHER